MRELVTVEEAVNLIQEQITMIGDSETVRLKKAVGRLLSRDIKAPIDQPPFDRSAVDGYACRSEQLCGASAEEPVQLEVTAEIDAGEYYGKSVGFGEAVRIMTGAPVPAGCDCCVRQEDTDYGKKHVRVFRDYQHYENICFQGEDYRKDTILLTAQTKIGGVEAGLLASMGFERVPVYRNPKVTLITTGDEVMEPGEKLLPGKIYDANQYLLAGRFQELGLEICCRQTVQDDDRVLAETLVRAAGDADLVLTTGGVSVGKKDLFHQALEAAGTDKIFWRVRLKPGTPTIFSVLNGTPVISLSGNPFGALANFELLVRPALQKLTGDKSWNGTRTTAYMAEDFPKASHSRRFIRAVLKGDQVYLPSGLHSSGVLSSMQGCNCMIDIPPGTMKLDAGDQVSVLLLVG